MLHGCAQAIIQRLTAATRLFDGVRHAWVSRAACHAVPWGCVRLFIFYLVPLDAADAFGRGSR